ncbi:uncharacterized protein LOC127749808 [Frankliniella occidentalis]|uniref:Uncharacterized protein LOC127749808 n=1 Tax=Frankliniella occidentalis TaxID=133901 RepID=A0A9C6X0K8_FRAOC|nr:uncharacterized protein LOC127749808 [Frankliniella occidentalis]
MRIRTLAGKFFCNLLQDTLITSPKQTTSVTKDISITSPDQPPSRKRDLRDVFKENIITENILSKYESTGILTEYDRGHIVERAVQYLLQLNPRPSHQEQALLAGKICHVFKFEETTSYYVAPSSTCKNATSKIPIKIQNIRYSLKKRMDGVPVKFDFSAHSNKDELTKLAGSCDKEDEDVLTALLALKHLNTDSWPDILKHWTATHRLRRQQLFEEIQGDNDSDPRYLEVEEYFEIYSILKAPNGYMLLCQVFAELYPGRENCLLALWENYCPSIISLVEEETAKNDSVTLELLSAVNKVKGDA